MTGRCTRTAVSHCRQAGSRGAGGRDRISRASPGWPELALSIRIVVSLSTLAVAPVREHHFAVSGKNPRENANTYQHNIRSFEVNAGRESVRLMRKGDTTCGEDARIRQVAQIVVVTSVCYRMVIHQSFRKRIQ
ncbi:MAG: hypothetical protein GX422_17350 [Deltaproteobacteria bacterium]|nr:hypothetical protein [Deltaproteobacteria bacterium]